MLEITAVLSTLLCVLLLNMKNKYGWSAAIIAAGLYLLIFIQAHLYAQVILQIIFIGQSIYGYRYWQSSKNKTVKVKKLNTKVLFIHTFITIVIGIIIYPMVEHYNGFASLLDVEITVLSLLANHYLSKGYLQSWLLWILVDVLLIGLFAIMGMWWSMGLYIILLGNAANAFYEWNKELTYEEI